MRDTACSLANMAFTRLLIAKQPVSNATWHHLYNGAQHYLKVQHVYPAVPSLNPLASTQDLIADAWSCDLAPEQVKAELAEIGRNVSLDMIRHEYGHHEAKAQRLYQLMEEASGRPNSFEVAFGDLHQGRLGTRTSL